MKVLVTGAAGQVGRALIATAPVDAEVIAATREQIDISDAAAVDAFLAAEKPSHVINAAAYTGVDTAETEAEAAHAVNAEGPANLARAAATHGARLLHISTDFVFDGTSSVPYAPDAPTSPLGVYGESKLAGERAVLDTLPDRSLVLRTAWVYAPAGRNFLLTMLRLMREHGHVRVIADQVGTPTAASSIAATLWALAERDSASGIFHWTDSGVASWYDFAVAIAEEGLAAGLLETSPEVVPITTADYPTPARRPHYSVLNCCATIDAINRVPDHWRVSLRRALGEVDRD